MESLVSVLILLPLLSASVCYFIRSGPARSLVVLLTGLVLIVSSFLLVRFAPFAYSPQILPGLGIHSLIQIPDFVLMFAILYFGFKHRSLLIKVISSLQIV